MGRKADQLRKSLLNRELADVPERAGGEKSRGKIRPREDFPLTVKPSPFDRLLTSACTLSIVYKETTARVHLSCIKSSNSLGGWTQTSFLQR